MKKILTLWLVIAAGALLAGCTLLGNKPMMSSNDDMMSWNDMGNGMMMHNVKSEEEFIVNMIPHHQEAVDTATIIVEKSTNSELKQLAQNIIDAQTKEIAMMQGWLKQRYLNSTLKSDYKNMMPELESLTGNALDSAFLQWMMMHHMWAIHMAQSLLKVEHRAETMTLANNIITTQQQEIVVMKDMLHNIK